MPNVSQEKRETLISVAAMSQLLGISPRAIQDLARRGVIPKASTGRYPMLRGVSSYCTHIRALAAGRPRTAKEPDAPSDPRDGRGEVTQRTLDAARQRLVEEQTEGQRIKNEEARGQLIRAADVELAWSGIFAAARSRLRAIPRRAKMTLGLEPSQASGLQRLVDLALEEVADGPARRESSPDDPEGDDGLAAA